VSGVSLIVEALLYHWKLSTGSARSAEKLSTLLRNGFQDFIGGGIPGSRSFKVRKVDIGN
jgi:hypothetical protein